MFKIPRTVSIPYARAYRTSRQSKRVNFAIFNQDVEIHLTGLVEKEFPMAFRVTDYGFVVQGAKSNQMVQISKADGQYFKEDIRKYNGKYYRPIRFSYGSAISTEFIPPQIAIGGMIERETYAELNKFDGPRSHGVVATSSTVFGTDNLNDMIKLVNRLCGKLVVFDGKLWEQCEAPGYKYSTFGCSGEGGDVGFFIEYGNHSNFHFAARHKSAAVRQAVECAMRRSQEKAAEEIRKTKLNIEVFK